MELPANVKLIVSTLPDLHEILDTLQTIHHDTEQYVKVNELGKDDSWYILNLWLKLKSQTITAQQKLIVSEAIKTKVRPLYQFQFQLQAVQFQFQFQLKAVQFQFLKLPQP